MGTVYAESHKDGAYGEARRGSRKAVVEGWSVKVGKASKMIDSELSPEATERVLEFAREALQEKIENLLDDPSWLLEPEENPALYFRRLRQIAAALGLDYDRLVDTLGHEVERVRLRDLEAKATGT